MDGKALATDQSSTSCLARGNQCEKVRMRVSQTSIREPDRRTNEQGVDDADEDDIDSDVTLIE